MSELAIRSLAICPDGSPCERVALPDPLSCPRRWASRGDNCIPAFAGFITRRLGSLHRPVTAQGDRTRPPGLPPCADKACNEVSHTTSVVTPPSCAPAAPTAPTGCLASFTDTLQCTGRRASQCESARRAVSLPGHIGFLVCRLPSRVDAAAHPRLCHSPQGQPPVRICPFLPGFDQ